MNCTKCQDTGWLCEEHPEQRQSHFIALNFMCTEAGIPCTCEKLKTEELPSITPTTPLSEMKIGVKYKLVAGKLWEGYVCREYIVDRTTMTGIDKTHFFWTLEEKEAAGFGVSGVLMREVVEPPTKEEIWAEACSSPDFYQGALWMQRKLGYGNE